MYVDTLILWKYWKFPFFTKKYNDLSTSGRFENPIVTEITEACEFYPAEEYHQCYLEKQGRDWLMKKAYNKHPGFVTVQLG